MRSLKIVIAVFFIGINLNAVEGASVKSESAEEKDYSGKQSSEWETVQKNLGAAKAKVLSQEQIVKALIVENKKTDKTDEIKIEHTKLRNYVLEYNRLNDEYETRFPEKGIKEKRKYQRTEAKSVETLDKELSVQSQLELLHKKVLKKYPLKKSATKNKEKTKKAHQVEPAKPKDVTDQIIFKK